jgi:photosystem II stability/assembly factor-like uncharacterized protein
VDSRNHIASAALILVALMTPQVHSQSIWQQTNGPYGGFILSLAISPSGVSSGHLFAGTDGSGVFRSTDKGATWNPVNIGLRRMYIESLVSNAKGDIIAGTYGVYKSTDDGATWNQTTLVANDVPSLAISKSGPFSGNIFAGTGAGVYRSTDGGDTWIQVGIADIGVSAIAADASGNIFASSAGYGVFRSTDNGNNWDEVNTGLDNTTILSLAINSTADLFVGTIGGVFRSTDRGENWSEVNTGLRNTYVQSLAITPQGDIFAGTFGDGVYRSTNNGSTWTSLGAVMQNTSVKAIIVSSTGQIFAGGNSMTLLHSTDNGQTWATTVVARILAITTALAVRPGGDIFAGTGDNGIFRSRDNGSTWDLVALRDSLDYVGALAVDAQGYIFAGGWGSVYRSTDGGQSWSATLFSDRSIGSIAVSPNGHIFAGAGQGVFRSTDGGLTWVQVVDLRSIHNLETSFVTCLAINTSGFVYAGTNGTEILESTDDGFSWYKMGLYGRSAGSAGAVLSLAINSKGVVFATTQNGMYIFGGSDKDWSGGIEGKLAINSKDYLFSGSGSYILKSTDDGENWTDFSKGLTESTLWSLIISRWTTTRDFAYAGTDSGVFRTLGPTTSAEKNKVDELASCFLLQNYPNPFNPSTTIEFGLPKAALVTLRIFDLLGQQVEELVNEKLAPGMYKTRWDARGFASGVYFYLLQARPTDAAESGGFVDRKKLLLLK